MDRRMLRRRSLSLSRNQPNTDESYGVSDQVWILQGKTEHHAVIEAIRKEKWLVKWVVHGSRQWIDSSSSTIKPYFRPLIHRHSRLPHKLEARREEAFLSRQTAVRSPAGPSTRRTPQLDNLSSALPDVPNRTSPPCAGHSNEENCQSQSGTSMEGNILDKKVGKSSVPNHTQPDIPCVKEVARPKKYADFTEADAELEEYATLPQKHTNTVQHVQNTSTHTGRVLQKQPGDLGQAEAPLNDDSEEQDKANENEAGKYDLDNESSASHPDQAEGAPCRSAYLCHFEQCLQYVLNDRKDFGILFDKKEHEIIERFNTLSCNTAKILYVRIFQRKGPWFRLESLLKYREEGSDEGGEEAVASIVEALSDLLDAKLIDVLPPSLETKSSIDAAIEAAASCLTVNELKSIAKRLGGTKRSNLHSTGSNRADFLECLEGRVRTQKTVFGAPLPFLTEIKRHLLCNLKSNGLVSPKYKDNLILQKFLLVRLSKRALILFRRVIRLLYLTTHTSALSSGAGSVPSIHSTPDLSPGLLVLFKKRKYAAYNCMPRTVIFEAREDLLRWESAIELRHLMDNILRYETGKDEQEAPSCLADELDEIISCSTNLFNFDDKAFHGGIDPEEFPSLATKAAHFAFDCHGSLESKENKKEDFPEFLLQLHCGWVLASVIWDGVHLLEKRRAYAEAIIFLQGLLKSNFSVHRRGRWWNRLALDLQHLGKSEEAFAACKQALSDKYVKGGDKIEIQRRYGRLKDAGAAENPFVPQDGQDPDDVDFMESCSNPTALEGGIADNDPSSLSSYQIDAEAPKWKVDSIEGNRLNRVIGQKSRFVGFEEGDACGVENLVLQFYKINGGWVGMHCEGRPLTSLFTLLLWDVIFLDIPDVFQTPFQDAPLDLDFSPLFYENRMAKIEAKLQEIKNSTASQLAESIFRAWNEHFGVVCRGVNWTKGDLHLLQAIAVCFGGFSLAKVCETLCKNFKHFNGGLPDLLLLKIEAPSTETPSSPLKSCGDQDGSISVQQWLSETALGCPREERSAQPGSTESDQPPAEFCGLEFPSHLTYKAMMVEVKGPNDHLSSKQMKWLNILADAGVDARVCKVSETFAKKRRKKVKS